MLALRKLYLDSHVSITRDYYIRQTIARNRRHVLDALPFIKFAILVSSCRSCFSQSLIDIIANNPVCVCSSSRKVTSIPRRNSTCTIVNCFNFGIRATLPLHHYYARIRTLCNEQLNFERYSVVHYAFAKRSKFGDDRDRV